MENRNKLSTYVVVNDSGAAPNPFGGVCTLAICKPDIRKNAQIGDWVIGTRSKRQDDSSNIYLIYAMKVTKIMIFEDYDEYCRTNLPIKIPNIDSPNYEGKVGDCIYDFENVKLTDKIIPSVRVSVHCEDHRDNDLSGKNVLLSDHFYYFGDKPQTLLEDLIDIVKYGPGHKNTISGRSEQEKELFRKFVEWINKFEKNKLYGNPGMKPQIKTGGKSLSSGCGGCSVKTIC